MPVSLEGEQKNPILYHKLDDTANKRKGTTELRVATG